MISIITTTKKVANGKNSPQILTTSQQYEAQANNVTLLNI
jgi:hypothetical protein